MHPMVALRPCEVCKLYVFDKKTGLPLRKPANDPNGQLIPLGNRQPPCEDCPKIPVGVEPKPENAEDLTEQNKQAYRHWQECDAVNWQNVPDSADPQVRRNAAIIREVHRRTKKESDLSMMALLMGVGIRNRGTKP